MSNPTVEEITQAADVINRLDTSSGHFPTELFYAIAAKWVTAILEVVPLRRTVAGSVEALLLKRPADDPIWPHMLHTPGTVLRSSDLTGDGLSRAFHRIAEHELSMTEYLDCKSLYSEFRKMDRGTELAVIYYTDLSNSEIPVGTWYRTDMLPTQFIETQRVFVLDAVSAFLDRDTVSNI